MQARLRTVARLLGAEDICSVPWEKMRYQHVAAIRARLIEEGLSPASVNATLSALRGIAEASWNLDLIDATELEKIRSVKPVKASTLPAGRSATKGELSALLDACARDRSSAGARDGAIIAVLYAGGLRRAELAALDLGDWQPETRELKVRHGKGRKERAIYLAGGAADALEDWIIARGAEPGALFMPINKGGVIARKRMTSQALYNALLKRAGDAGVKRLSPHDMRRTFVVMCTNCGHENIVDRQRAEL